MSGWTWDQYNLVAAHPEHNTLVFADEEIATLELMARFPGTVTVCVPPTTWGPNARIMEATVLCAGRAFRVDVIPTYMVGGEPPYGDAWNLGNAEEVTA